MVKLMDLTNHKAALMPFETSYQITMLKMDSRGELLLVSDEADYLYMFNLSNGRLVGKKSFKQKITGIFFNSKNSLIFIASGRFVFIYEKP